MIDKSDSAIDPRPGIHDGLSELPSAEDLHAWTEGNLSDEEGERVRKALEDHPELAEDLQRPLPEPEPGTPYYLSDQQVEAGWTRLAASLPALAEASDSQATVVTLESKDRTDAGADRRTLFALAALFFVVIFGALYFAARQEVALLEAALRSPQATPQHRLLLPDLQRGDSGPVLLSTNHEHFLLKPALIDTEGHSKYRLRALLIEGEGEREVWATDLGPPKKNTFEIWMPSSFLEAGQHRLELSGIRDDGTTRVLATYTVQLEP